MAAIKNSLWLKSKGYRHVTNKINVFKHGRYFISKITKPENVSKHAFFPLIHSVIYEPRYKLVDKKSGKRSHKKLNKKTNQYERVGKPRPLHYATHIDSLIYSYYAQILAIKYEKNLGKNKDLNESVIAYRKIPDPDNPPKNKSTIHFAKEAFHEIISRSEKGDVAVLKFDIKSFFNSIRHDFLLYQWKKVLNLKETERLQNDHYNVFKAVTKFSYVLLDDFRLQNINKEKARGFDEVKLASLRKNGILSFFKSPEEMREQIKTGKIKLYKYPFRDKKTNVPIGIPQGLPISSVLANIYLYDFDLKVINYIIEQKKGFYRRYSDDMIVIINTNDIEDIYDFMTTAIKESGVEMSEEKTEKFIFKKRKIGRSRIRLTSILINETECKINVPFTFLGFEFYGYQILIKSSNLAKFYRRMIFAVKRKARRAITYSENNPDTNLFLFKRQLYRLFTLYNLNKQKLIRRHAYIEENERGYFEFKHKRVKNITSKSNYLNYVNRASNIMNESAIIKQLRNHKRIFREAIRKHLKKK